MKVFVILWWRPRKIEGHFSKQGIRGPPYHFFIGNVKEVVGMMLKASSQPMPFSHNILPRVLSFYHHWKKIYGTASFLNNLFQFFNTCLFIFIIQLPKCFFLILQFFSFFVWFLLRDVYVHFIIIKVSVCFYYDCSFALVFDHQDFWLFERLIFEFLAVLLFMTFQAFHFYFYFLSSDAWCWSSDFGLFHHLFFYFFSHTFSLNSI